MLRGPQGETASDPSICCVSSVSIAFAGNGMSAVSSAQSPSFYNNRITEHAIRANGHQQEGHDTKEAGQQRQQAIPNQQVVDQCGLHHHTTYFEGGIRASANNSIAFCVIKRLPAGDL